MRHNLKPVLQVKRQNYSVLFNMDVSESMDQNRRWQKACECVSRFVGHLSTSDIVSAILFN